MNKAGNGRDSMRKSTEDRCHDCARPLPTDPVIVIVDGETHPFDCRNCAAGFLVGDEVLFEWFTGACEYQGRRQGQERK